MTLVKPVILLNSKEKSIFKILLETVDHIRKHYPVEKSVVLRVAGGWVRDKVLGIESVCKD